MDTDALRQARERLDQFIAKQRVAMYKPIQIAEILYRVRVGGDDKVPQPDTECPFWEPDE